ncbi:MAG: ABC transporter permease [Sulfuritalea sp.]|nr:ABC transporter permease [Sulfuritalea sp.]
MFEFALGGIRSGVRGRSFQAVFFLGLVLIGIAYLSGNFSPRQPKTVALDVGLSGLRFSLILLNLFWVQELVAREIDRRTVLFSLAYPVARSAFLLGRFLAVLVLSLLAATIMGFLLGIAVVFAGGQYVQEFSVSVGLPYWIVLIGFWLDAAVVGAFTLCMASLATVSFFPIVLGATFAVAGKSLGAALEYIGRGADGDVELVSKFSPLLETVRWVLPDLSRLDWRDWPMYGLPPSIELVGYSTLMAFAYIALMLSVAVMQFSKREFG